MVTPQASPQAAPRLLLGRVAHFRKRPARHGFAYPVFEIGRAHV